MAEVGTRGWVFNGPQLYAARIEQIEARGFFVHYEGWKRKWDEWIAPDEFLEDTEENRQRSEQLRAQMKKAAKQPDPAAAVSTRKRARGGEDSAAAAAASDETTKQQQQPRDVEDFLAQNQESDEIYGDSIVISSSGNTSGGNTSSGSGSNPNTTAPSGSTLRVTLPEDLKQLLVRDWESFMQHDKQLMLPCTVTVKRILLLYSETKKQHPTAYAQFAQALELYFNRALPLVLLFSGEDDGDTGSGNSNSAYSERFGAEHLLRLCVRLPNLVTTAGMDDADAKQLCVRVNDLLRFISRRKQDLFQGNSYVPRRLLQQQREQQQQQQQQQEGEAAQ